MVQELTAIVVVAARPGSVFDLTRRVIAVEPGSWMTMGTRVGAL
jgi:hypothetical protein